MPELKERAKTLVDLVDAASFLWASRPLTLDDKAAALLTPEARALVAEILPDLETVEPWTAETAEQAVRGYAERKAAKLGAVAQPLRAALTGSVAPAVAVQWSAICVLAITAYSPMGPGTALPGVTPT